MTPAQIAKIMTLPPLPEPEVWCSARDARVNFTRHQMEAYARAALAAQPEAVGEPVASVRVEDGMMRGATRRPGMASLPDGDHKLYAAAPTEANPAQQDAVDAELLDWLEAQINEHGAIHLHDGNNPNGHGLGLRPGSLSRSLRDAIRAAISAKKGG